ncbi:Cdc37 N terminal kinase binding-domain-containing protein [Irpex rosettiformis]|uniref:Cdc37 N terminal kinase binding-domain-containing protein n=1 Tax=Irpex rosettiformis TaxID=378272 RepID=A0ACB8TRV5_9APHY|nr:Cdc37 N terminal kinase binding-domain-containing protein [Irpex rosettiformis]
MPLNYSKWDNLELSDDSDIEGHPNVDKKSLIRWKQRDIHEKREMRKLRIAQLSADIACNNILQPRLAQIAEDVASKGPSEFTSLVERFKTNPSPECPPTTAPEQKTYDGMLLSLMLAVWEEAKGRGVEKDDPKLGEKLSEGLKKHVVQMKEHQEKLKKDLASEEAEQKKKITSDDIHEGFESKYIPAKPEPTPIKNAIPSSSSTSKSHKTTTEFEVLNPKGISAASSSKPDEEDDDENTVIELPELTPSLVTFSHLPLKGFEQSWEFIKAHREVIVPGASDALLVAAFNAQSEGKAAYARQCVHQSLLLQYCDKLGKDGVSIFFRKMIANDPRAVTVFEKDVLDTYAHLVERVRIVKAEEAASGGAGEEQIQLVPEDPSQTISFNVPDGPPPEKFVLEGPGMENYDVEEVRKALQMRWDVFSAFSEDLKEALKTQKLEDVNKVLGKMKVEDAEEVVRLLDLAGILNFGEHGVRDETGKGKGRAEDDGEEADEEDEGDEVD